MDQPPQKLLDQVRDALRLKHYTSDYSVSTVADSQYVRRPLCSGLSNSAFRSGTHRTRLSLITRRSLVRIQPPLLQSIADNESVVLFVYLMRAVVYVTGLQLITPGRRSSLEQFSGGCH